MEISATAWAAGIAGALLYLVLAWPLAMILSYGRVIFHSFYMKFLAAIVIGVSCAPLGETYAPFLETHARRLIGQSDNATHILNSVARFLN